ncbi:Uncharacterized protein dnm_090920 [Desulfonema magnum]|uniref:Uncharacterized protein n=1 Tax=Desulfonema magnum TaxID=45655 RepID=A0A975GTF0_9BACT|nr:Uncharacterized protein dnm_090920 [Desulfonema magnum]
MSNNKEKQSLIPPFFSLQGFYVRRGDDKKGISMCFLSDFPVLFADFHNGFI